MLHYSFSTVLMAFLASNVIALLTALCLGSKKILPNISYRLLCLFSLLALLRLLFPLELPFTSNVILPAVPSRIIAFIRSDRIEVLGHGFSIWNLFEILWLAGIIASCLLLAIRHAQFKNYLKKYGIDKTGCPDYRAILDAVCRQYKKPNSFRILELPGQKYR